MSFEPVVLSNLFDEQDVSLLREIIDAKKGRVVRYDSNCRRELIENDQFEEYFSEKLKPLARKVFNDPTLETSFSMYAKYDSNSSMLPPHTDKGACTYTLDYCLSANVDWPLTIDGIDYHFTENEALAFMGETSTHGRSGSIGPDGFVELVFFHFVPKTHWYFSHCDDIVVQ